jgi:hypothetical protein
MRKDTSDASKKSSRQFDDGLLEPEEFKDAPIRFTMELDGRKEPVKIVEPKIDVALPRDGRLMIHERDRCLYDLNFRFDQTADKPYRLLFRVKEGVGYANDHVQAFGEALPEDKQLRNHYRKELLDQDGLRSWIEMTDGKARLLVQCDSAANSAK